MAGDEQRITIGFRGQTLRDIAAAEQVALGEQAARAVRRVDLNHPLAWKDNPD